MKEKYGQFVHEFVDENGNTWYAVAKWCESQGQYQRPLDIRTCKLTGCSVEYARSLATLGGYKTRREALRRARYLFEPKDYC